MHFAFAGEPMVCSMSVSNTGNVRLNGIQTSGDASCMFEPVLQPYTASNITCNISKAATQNDFESGNMALSVSAAATPSGTSPAQITAPASVTVPLPVRKQLLLTLSRTDGSAVVDRAGSLVQLTVTATNGGNIQMRAIALDVPGLAALTCSNASDVVTLPTELLVGSSITCSGSFVFSQDALEAGSRNFSAAGSASNLGGAGAASNVVEVVVAASPQLQLDVDALNCTRPPRMRESPRMLQLVKLRAAEAHLRVW
jgi:hypothetical protein